MSSVDTRAKRRVLSSHQESVLAISLLTLVTVFGAFLAAFWIFDNHLIRSITAGMPAWQLIAIRMPIFLSPFFLGGGLWGFGLARFTDTTPAWPAARTGGLSVGGMALLLELPIHFSQALPPPDIPLGVHIGFAAVLMLEVSLVAAVATSRTARRLPVVSEQPGIGFRTGLAAAAGFLIASLMALPLGWEVRAGNGPGMISALYLGIAVASITAGAYLGHRFFEASQGT